MTCWLPPAPGCLPPTSAPSIQGAAVSRVLSTTEAREAIAHMHAVISGGLTDQIGHLKQQGQRLSDPNVWDGSLAGQFRSTWPQTAGMLDRITAELEDLRVRIDRVNADIMTAGGN
jgi:hypothetical protein